MPVYTLTGLGESIVTCGMGTNHALGVDMPFIGFAAYENVAEAIGLMETGEVRTGTENVGNVLDAFSEHGTVVFIDNINMGVSLLDMMKDLMSISIKTDWIKRRQNQHTIN